MACIDDQEFAHHSSGTDLAQRLWARFSDTVSGYLERQAIRRQQKLDRKAFMNLMGKEDWLYDDMGIHPGDVAWAARLPIEVNAAKELEKLKLQNRKNL